jgi:hypothetical protein
MGKKCIPGAGICIENMTLFIMTFSIIIFTYLYYVHVVKPQYNSNNQNSNPQIIIVSPLSSNQPFTLGGISTQNNILNDPYSPPLKNDGYYFERNSSDTRAVPPISPPVQIPVNIETRGLNTQYSQVGILTKNTEDNLILPLMGRRHMSGRDKWQYYSMSNTGSLNTKLPVSVNGKSCTSEYGCDQLMNGDTVFVEGYKTTFKATIYENSMFNYLPF